VEPLDVAQWYGFGLHETAVDAVDGFKGGDYLKKRKDGSFAFRPSRFVDLTLLVPGELTREAAIQSLRLAIAVDIESSV
jgi:hypothetical protein